MKFDKGELESTRIWTIDVGEHSWRNLHESFIIPEEMWKLEKANEGMGFEMLETEDSEWFFEQFIGLRSLITVDRYIEGKFKKNIIIEHAPPQMNPEYNVLTEQTGEHFFSGEKHERQLPF